MEEGGEEESGGWDVTLGEWHKEAKHRWIQRWRLDAGAGYGC